MPGDTRTYLFWKFSYLKRACFNAPNFIFYSFQTVLGLQEDVYESQLTIRHGACIAASYGTLVFVEV